MCLYHPPKEVGVLHTNTINLSSFEDLDIERAIKYHTHEKDSKLPEEVLTNSKKIVYALKYFITFADEYNEMIKKLRSIGNSLGDNYFIANLEPANHSKKSGFEKIREFKSNNF